MQVERIPTGDHGSYIEPPLDERWSDLDKLRWQAAVVTIDTGVHVEVAPTQQQTWRWGAYRANPGYWDIIVEGSQSGMYTFMEAWVYMNGVRAGARAEAYPWWTPDTEGR